jgi:hypothetical protein
MGTSPAVIAGGFRPGSGLGMGLGLPLTDSWMWLGQWSPRRWPAAARWPVVRLFSNRRWPAASRVKAGARESSLGV